MTFSDRFLPVVTYVAVWMLAILAAEAMALATHWAMVFGLLASLVASLCVKILYMLGIIAPKPAPQGAGSSRTLDGIKVARGSKEGCIDVGIRLSWTENGVPQRVTEWYSVPVPPQPAQETAKTDSLL